MILETHTIPILINHLASVFHIGVLIDNRGRWFQHVHEKNPDKETDQERQQMKMIEKFHSKTL
jgi:hypothetical protein